MISRSLRALRRATPVLVLATIASHAQTNYFHTHGADLSVGGNGNFSTILEQSSASGSFSVPRIGGGTTTTTVSNQRQDTTLSAGFVTTFDFHPKPWAGIAFNYGFTHYSERFSNNYSSVATVQRTSIPTDWHEFTGAYQFHPRHIPFQPYVNVGGGAIDFAPSNASSQFRGAGLLEAGFDLPVHYSHMGFRISGRSLYYRSPNFYQPALSTRSWRVTTQPTLSTYYRF